MGASVPNNPSIQGRSALLGGDVMKRYIKVQIIKHALMKYIQRPEATQKEIEREKRLIQEYTEEAEWLKQKYKIKERRNYDY